MSKITQKENDYIYIYVCKLREPENNSPLKAGVYKGTGDPYRAESVSVCPNSELF